MSLFLCQSPSRRRTHFYLTLIFCWFYAGFQPRFPGYFPGNSENGCFFGHFNIFKDFLWKGRIRGERISTNFGFLPVLAASFQTYGFILATQYDRRSPLLTPCGFYSGDLLSLPRCVQQTIITSNVCWSSERFRRFGSLFRSHRANAGYGSRRVFLIQPSGRQQTWHKTWNHVNALCCCCLQASTRR